MSKQLKPTYEELVELVGDLTKTLQACANDRATGRKLEKRIAREIINQLETLKSQKDLPRVVKNIGDMVKPWLAATK